MEPISVMSALQWLASLQSEATAVVCLGIFGLVTGSILAIKTTTYRDGRKF